jgi:hypothetical protein
MHVHLPQPFFMNEQQFSISISISRLFVLDKIRNSEHAQRNKKQQSRFRSCQILEENRQRTNLSVVLTVSH